MIVIVEAREVGPGRDKLVGIATYRCHIHTRTYIKIISPSPAVGVDPWIITGSFEDHNNAFLKRPFSRPSSTTSGFHVHQMQVPCGLSRGLSRTARNTGQKEKNNTPSRETRRQIGQLLATICHELTEEPLNGALF